LFIEQKGEVLVSIGLANLTWNFHMLETWLKIHEQYLN